MGEPFIRHVRYSFARPGNSTPYDIGDAIADSATAGSVLPMTFEVSREEGGAGKIIGAQLLTDSASAFAAIRLHLFNRAPFAEGGYQADNAAIALTYAAQKTGAADSPGGGPKVPNALPIIDFTTFTAKSSSASSIGACDQTELAFMCAGGSKLIYGLLECRAVFTPGSGQNFCVILHAEGRK